MTACSMHSSAVHPSEAEIRLALALDGLHLELLRRSHLEEPLRELLHGVVAFGRRITSN